MLKKSSLIIIIVLLILSITILIKPTIADENKTVVINFAECKPDTKVIYVAFGSTTYEVVSKQKNNCLMNYGGEVENPNWDGFLNMSCSIPVKLGKQEFKVTDAGVDFSPIAKYCKKDQKTTRNS
ncbi:MAG: hypothetical protein IPK14_07870 [Blastocatellia bacterium]|nr:hypothetical protein [Blastocatellia bacterium]